MSVPRCTNQDFKRVFLIASDGPTCVGPHVRTCARTQKRVCVFLSLFQTVQATSPKRDPDDARTDGLT